MAEAMAPWGVAEAGAMDAFKLMRPPRRVLDRVSSIRVVERFPGQERRRITAGGRARGAGSVRARLYHMFRAGRPNPYHGAQRANRFVQDFAGSPVPWGDGVAAAEAAGPCSTFPIHDAWTDVPHVPGAVLVGDAAGYSNPLCAPGLSICMRDVRQVGPSPPRPCCVERRPVRRVHRLPGSSDGVRKSDSCCDTRSGSRFRISPATDSFGVCGEPGDAPVAVVERVAFRDERHHRGRPSERFAEPDGPFNGDDHALEIAKIAMLSAPSLAN